LEKIKNFTQLHRDGLRVTAHAVILALIPVFCCAARCLIDGRSPAEIYLPASPWNDELFYYKMTENVINYGYPQGYFGFNESHGLYLSFAAWSPVLLVFWVAWGFIFGWNLLSPMLCNTVLLSLSMLLFGISAKPDKRQTLTISILYILFMPITRFALSCIPEAELFALFIVFIGLAISCGRNCRPWKAGVMIGLIMLMTWMRPYLILLFLTPAVFLFRKKGKITLLISGASAGITAAVYAAINHFFSAPYLTDLFYTEWIKIYFEEGFLRGLRYTVWKLYTSFGTVRSLIRDNLFVGEGLISAAGLYYFIFLLLVCVLFVKLFFRFRRKEWSGFLLEGQMFLCMAGFFTADLLMYRIQEGGRHTLVYIVGCLFLLPMSDVFTRKKGWLLPAGLSVLFLFLFTVRGNVPYEFAIPYGSEEERADLASLSEQLSENMALTGEAPNYDNTVIWTAWDVTDEGTKMADFGSYYAVPTGFGINLCDGGYMEANLEKLQSRYIGVTPGSAFEKRCQEAGGRLIGRGKKLAVYDRKPLGNED